MDSQLFNRSGSESITGYNQNLVFVLQKEETNLGEVGGFTNAVDADDRDYIRSLTLEGERGGRSHGVDFAEEIEG